MRMLNTKLRKSVLIICIIFLVSFLFTFKSRVQSATSDFITVTNFAVDPADDFNDNKATINIELTANNLNYTSASISILLQSDENSSVFELMQPLNADPDLFVGNKLQLTQIVPVLYEGNNIISCGLIVNGLLEHCDELGVSDIVISKVTPEVPVYRFFNNKLGTHLYTTSLDELGTMLDNFLSTVPNNEWNYEGYKFYVYSDNSTNAASVPVYRFFNTKEGGHLYTISDAEKNTISSTLPKYNYEGIKFYVMPDATDGFVPVYRFFNTKTGTHLYTISEIEKSTIQNTLTQYNFEGEKFHVLDY
jgi:hypothetical protein